MTTSVHTNIYRRLILDGLIRTNNKYVSISLFSLTSATVHEPIHLFRVSCDYFSFKWATNEEVSWGENLDSVIIVWQRYNGQLFRHDSIRERVIIIQFFES